MIRTAFLASALAAAMVPSANAATAYLARTGSGSACTQSVPCASMSLAIAAAGANGEVICLDKGNYSGAGTITFSITISCADSLWAAPGGIISINTPAGAVVVIEGLVMDGNNAAGTPFSFVGQGSLHLRHVRSGNNSGSAHGFNFAPSGPGTLHVSDSVFYDNAGTGMLIKPTSGGNANVTVSRSYFTGNFNGIFVDGSGGGNGVNLNVRDSVVSGSTNSGIPIFAPTVPVTALIDRTTVNYSFNTGVAAAGTGALVRIGNSTISNNVKGVLAFDGATMLSFKNNHIKANTTNNTPIAADNLD